jgi:hypothetical protein
VTYDGQWVIATTDDYVMVVNTHWKEDGKFPAGVQELVAHPSRLLESDCIPDSTQLIT